MTEEVRTTSSTGGQKGVKPAKFSLIPSEALWEVAELYGFGAEKYEAHNWRKGYEWSKSLDAMQRHLHLFQMGEDIDPETGKSHMASVVFHALAIIVFMKEHPEFDDRWKPELSDEAREIYTEAVGMSPEQVAMATLASLNERGIYHTEFVFNPKDLIVEQLDADKIETKDS